MFGPGEGTGSLLINFAFNRGSNVVMLKLWYKAGHLIQIIFTVDGAHIMTCIKSIVSLITIVAGDK